MSTRTRRPKAKAGSRRRRVAAPSASAKLGKLLRDASAGERRTIYGAIKKMVGGKKRKKVRHAEPAEKRMISRYHELADKQLQATATQKELAELEQLDTKLAKLETEQSADIEKIQEERHKAVIEQLSSLATELRKIAENGEQRA